MSDHFDIGEFARSMADSNARLVRVGMQAAEERYQGAIRALDKGMQAAALDPEAKIPTYLAAAIHVLLLMKQLPAADYAETLIKRDQLARHEGRSDHDLTTRGEPLEAGR